MMRLFTVFFLTTLLFAVTSSHAHLTLNSLSLKEVQTFGKGDSVELTWKMDHAHNYTHYIYVRLDSNETWECIDSVPALSGLDYTYTWKIPEVATENGQLLVFLPEFRNTPAESEHYTTIFSSEFAIELDDPTAIKHAEHPAAPVQGKKSVPVTDKNYTLDGRVIRPGQLQKMATKKVPRLIILQKNGK